MKNPHHQICAAFRSFDKLCPVQLKAKESRLDMKSKLYAKWRTFFCSQYY